MAVIAAGAHEPMTTIAERGAEHLAHVDEQQDAGAVERLLDAAGKRGRAVTGLEPTLEAVNRNAVPFDPRPPAVSSGIRVGTPALATRGLQVEDFREVGRTIGEALTTEDFDSVRGELIERNRALAERYPLYPQLAPAPA